MQIRKVKNICALLAYVATIIGVSTTPYMIRWYLALFVIYLVALWLGHEDDHE